MGIQMETTHSTQKRGFTLAEILMAMMVFAIAISTILGLLARSIETADSILVKDEAISLSSALDSYMTELPFPTAYSLVKDGNNHLYAYQYRANPRVPLRADGTLEPYPIVQQGDKLGTDYVVVAGVRPPGDPFLDADVNAREGRLFQIYLEVSDINPFGNTNLPTDPDAFNSTTGYPAYDSAVIAVFADFYAVQGTNADAKALQISSVFSFNFAVRR